MCKTCLQNSSWIPGIKSAANSPIRNIKDAHSTPMSRNIKLHLPKTDFYQKFSTELNIHLSGSVSTFYNAFSLPDIVLTLFQAFLIIKSYQLHHSRVMISFLWEFLQFICGCTLVTCTWTVPWQLSPLDQKDICGTCTLYCRLFESLCNHMVKVLAL